VKTLLVVSGDEALRNRVEQVLDETTLFMATSDVEALKTLSLIDVDVVLRHSPAGAAGLEAFVARVKERAPHAGIIVAGAVEQDTEVADFVIPATCTASELQSAFRWVSERQRLLRENAALRTRSAGGAPALGDTTTAPWEGSPIARILKEFTRVFAAGSDLPRVLEMFLDAIGELVRPARMAILLPDDSGSYRIAAHHGVPPPIVRSVRLSGHDGLSRWLSTQGRPARLHDLVDSDVVDELRLLQGTLAVPLMAQGELVGDEIQGVLDSVGLRFPNASDPYPEDMPVVPLSPTEDQEEQTGRLERVRTA
jgi:hypothetical protein